MPLSKPTEQLSVLIVEDNAISRNVIASILRNVGICNIDMAENGKACLDMIERVQYDVILMDWDMPVMDGIQATQAIRQKLSENENPWITGISAKTREEDRKKALSAGMNDYLFKPVTQSSIETALDNIGSN